MTTHYIKIPQAQFRYAFTGALEDFINKKALDEWKNLENKYVGFYEAVIEQILERTLVDEPIEQNMGYYKAVFYNQEEIDRIREYGNGTNLSVKSIFQATFR